MHVHIQHNTKEKEKLTMDHKNVTTLMKKWIAAFKVAK